MVSCYECGNAIHERQPIWSLVELPPNAVKRGLGHRKWLFKRRENRHGGLQYTPFKCSSCSEGLHSNLRGDMKRELRVSCYTDVGYLTDADDLKS
ncbi:hypothetical protein Tco_1337460 [Tanacetum coccineum]